MAESAPSDIIIQGDARYIPQSEFEPKIVRCCTLLRTRAPNQYAAMRSSVVRIRAFERSGANVAQSAVDIARATFDASETWLASVLIHESHHIIQYKARRDYYGTSAELECNGVQLETLRLIGAPQNEISYLLAQTGNHFDLNGDGVYDERDYRLRNW